MRHIAILEEKRSGTTGPAEKLRGDIAAKSYSAD
jgi:hypothetical protein